MNYLKSLSLFAVFCLLPYPVNGKGLVQSLWSCFVPCHSRSKDQLVDFIHVTYCGTTVLGKSMLAELTPACQSQTKRSDVVAVRSSESRVADCISSVNPCEKKGLVRAGYMCSYICPSEEKNIQKYTTCAFSGEEAWSHVQELCPDATSPHHPFSSFTVDQCVPEGQTPCD